MTNRIPPSLNWLIDKRARLSGEIEKTRKSIKKTQELINELEDLEIKLKAIDTTLEMHDIKVNVDLIRPINSKYYRLNMPYGELTKSILTCLRLYGNEKPVSKSDIVNFVVNRHFDYDADPVTSKKIRRSITDRINCLYHDGLVKRHHSPVSTGDEGLWSLNNIYDDEDR